MGSKSPFDGIPGYKTSTVPYQSREDSGDLLLDITYPDTDDTSDCTVLLHYHGGFLVFGDRHSFPPYWLVNACVSRRWIFVTPDYRLIPETTAQSSVDDAFDAYAWVLRDLQRHVGRKVGSILMAGSSAGGYLALSTANRAGQVRQPNGLLLIYGMLDATNSRYTTPGTNVSGRPSIDTDSIFAKFPMAEKGDKRRVLSAYPMEGNPVDDPRSTLISALHLDAKFPDYMTGIKGLSQAIAKNGPEAINEDCRSLFPLSFGNLQYLPPTFLLHGKNDSAVPLELSITAAEKLKSAGVDVHQEFPEDAEHGFDVRIGNIDAEKGNENISVFQSMRKAIEFLDHAAKKEASA